LALLDGEKKFDNVSISTQYQHWPDRWTVGPAEMPNQYCCIILMHDKNVMCLKIFLSADFFMSFMSPAFGMCVKN